MRRGRLPGWVTLTGAPVAVAGVVLGSALLLTPGGTTGPGPTPDRDRLGPMLTAVVPDVRALPDPPHTKHGSPTTRSLCSTTGDATATPAVVRRWYLTDDVSGTGFRPEVTLGARAAVRSLAGTLVGRGWRGRTEPDGYGTVTLAGLRDRSRARLSIYCFGDRIVLRVTIAGRDVCRHLP